MKYTDKKPNIRREEIMKMIHQGFTYKSIANKYDVSKQRINQIAKENNIYRHIIKRKKHKRLINRIHKYLENNPSKNNSYAYYYDITKKFNLTTEDLNKLKRYGLKFSFYNILKDRNNNIIDDYFNKGLNAKNIINKNYGPLTVNGIYQICYNKIKTRKIRTKENLKNKYFEKEGIFNLVFNLRYNKKMTFQEITDYMNEQQYKTIYGKNFTRGNVFYKFNKAKKVLNL